MKREKHIRQLCDTVRETSFSIHKYLRHGHLEKIYENCLAHRLSKKGVVCRQQHPLTVRDEDDFVLGDFFADLLVDGSLLVELKACKTLNDNHIAQLLGYMRGCKIEHGLLINFGGPKLQIRKLVFSNEFRYE